LVGRLRLNVAVRFYSQLIGAAEAESEQGRNEQKAYVRAVRAMGLALDADLELESVGPDHGAAVRDPRTVRVDKVRLRLLLGSLLLARLLRAGLLRQRQARRYG